MMHKKGDLSLSITAIVVIVIAFVVLGLGLTLTRTIFKAAQSKIPEAISLTDLESKPTSENPVTISNEVEIKRNDEQEKKIGFYNKNSNAAISARLEIARCIKNNVDVTPTPNIDSISQNVPASDSRGYSVIITEKGLQPGTYICILRVFCDTNSGAVCPPGYDSQEGYEQKQFTLKVTA